MPLESVEEGFNRWRDRALEAELEIKRLQAEVEQLTEASRLFLNQRQEMAEERYAWQERGDRAETRVRHLEANRADVIREAIARVEDPAERAKSPIGLGLGWESAREVLRRMLHEEA